MRLQEDISNGPAPDMVAVEGPQKPSKNFTLESGSLPFGQSISLKELSGPTYTTAQTLVQQVAYSLSDRLWTYSPDTFDLDTAAKQWSHEHTYNAYGYSTNVQSMQIRSGAAAIALGYIFSENFDLKKRKTPQGILATSSSLKYLRSSLDQLSLLYSIASPFVAHIAAVDYVGGSSAQLLTDYASVFSLADELGFAMISSFSVHEVQHMALLSTLISTVAPSFHIYDGVRVGRETTRVIDIQDQASLFETYQAVSNELANKTRKTSSVETKVEQLLNAFNDELGTEYALFEYHGHAAPQSVLVTFGTVEASLSSQVADSLERDGAKVGVINVRVYRPFIEEAFIKALPKSVKVVGVLGQVMDRAAVSDVSVRSSLYSDVVTALAFADEFKVSPAIVDIKYPRSQAWTAITIAATFQMLVKKPLFGSEGEGSGLSLLESSVQQYTFWDLDTSSLTDTPTVLGKALSKDSASNVTVGSIHDNLVQGGIIRTDVRKSKKVVEASYSIDAADTVYIGNEVILEEIDVLNGVKAGGKTILRLSGVKDDDLEKKLTPFFRKSLADKGVQLFILDTQAIESGEASADVESYLLQIAFLRVAVPNSENVGIQKLSLVNGSLEAFESLATDLDKALRRIEVPESWSAIELSPDTPFLARNIIATSFAPSKCSEILDTAEASPPQTWHAPAKALAFREVYGTTPTLRPDLTVKTYNVSVIENRRLTPLTYDRNIFHIEFDLGDSGLKYAIGEALGIHAENDPTEVSAFIDYYKLSPDTVVQIPSRENPDILESRTVYQSLMQNVDLWGKPPKQFYESLAAYAENPEQKKELLSLGGLEGINEFRRRAEVDTITYADVIEEFTSARPSFTDLARMIAPMKRREYSIASCQKVTPNSVALMIVLVNWMDPRGRTRWGQATRYLQALRPGARVTVSVKPSVMKLPASSKAPIIMAGLGTGLAPFRAFVQHRAWEKQQGKEIGAVLLYMGSRHQREEYCYGEEWEAYRDAGIITLLGRAFSRDQPQKIYIQDRMRETLEEICQAYFGGEGVEGEGGAFYLCGPTWPVPDVQNVLEEGVVRWKEGKGEKVRKGDGGREILRLKEGGRYVLEVY